MADEGFRNLERDAHGSGDRDAERRLQSARCRVGECCAHSLEAPELPVAMPPIPAHARECRAWVSNSSAIQIRADPGHSAYLNITICLSGHSRDVVAARAWLMATFPDRPTQDFNAYRSLGRSFYGPRQTLPPIVKLVEVGCADCGRLGRIELENCKRCHGTGIVLYRSDRIPEIQS